jgi:ABC-type protease/lipase transport system fused ATPase/permease subunit
LASSNFTIVIIQTLEELSIFRSTSSPTLPTLSIVKVMLMTLILLLDWSSSNSLIQWSSLVDNRSLLNNRLIFATFISIFSF